MCLQPSVVVLVDAHESQWELRHAELTQTPGRGMRELMQEKQPSASL